MITPQASAGTYTLVKSMIAWVHKGDIETPEGDQHVPARHAVCLTYKTAGGDYIGQIEARLQAAGKERSTWPMKQNINQPLSDGYFFPNL